jgi:hypothetical protein
MHEEPVEPAFEASVKAGLAQCAHSLDQSHKLFELASLP